MSLLKKILNKRSSDDETLIANLAKEIGCTKSPINKFKNEESREFKNFDGLVQMVKLLDPEQETEIMIDYSTHIDVNTSTARYMLDYLSVNRELESMSDLITRMKESSNIESKLWADGYELLHLWQTKAYELNYDQFLIEVKQMKTKNIVSLEILQKLLECYVYDLKLFYKQVLEISSEIEFLISNVKDDFLKKVYSVKLYELLSNTNLWILNDLLQSRKLAQKVLDINIGQGFNAFGNYIIAQSYFYEDFQKAKEYYDKSIRAYEKIQRIEVADDIRITSQFLNIYWGENVDEYLSLENELYSKTKANINVDDLIHNNHDKLSEAFITLLKGIQENSTDSLLKSMILYLKGGDAYSSNLSRIELINRGYNEMILDELIRIYDK